MVEVMIFRISFFSRSCRNSEYFSRTNRQRKSKADKSGDLADKRKFGICDKSRRGNVPPAALLCNVSRVRVANRLSSLHIV